MKKSLFVISTIAGEGSARRHQADTVYNNIIVAAAKKLETKGLRQPGDIELKVMRSERDLKLERIDDRIIDAILNADLLAVVIFEDNGNVFYEVGISHAAGRPLLLIKHADFTMPFDLFGYPYIAYTDKDWADATHAMRCNGPVAALAAQMRAQLEEPTPRDPFKRKDIGALGGERNLNRFSDLPYREWSRILLDAEREIWIAGVSLWELVDPTKLKFFLPVEPDYKLPDQENAHISDLLIYAMGRGVNVTIIMMDPSNPALSAMLLRPRSPVARPAQFVSGVISEIERSYETWIEIRRQTEEAARSGQLSSREKPAERQAPAGHMRILRVRSGIISQRVTWTDKETVTTPFFNTIQYNSGGPAVRARGGNNWHRLFRDELQLLADHNPEAAGGAPGR